MNFQTIKVNKDAEILSTYENYTIVGEVANEQYTCFIYGMTKYNLSETVRVPIAIVTRTGKEFKEDEFYKIYNLKDDKTYFAINLMFREENRVFMFEDIKNAYRFMFDVNYIKNIHIIGD